MSAAFWGCATVTAISAFVSLGFSVSALAGSDPPGRRSAMYAMARSLALAVAATLALSARSSSWLEAVAVTMIIVQAADAVIGAVIHDRLKTLGPAVTSLVNAVALVWLLSQGT
ncbi:MAG: hypothetical protein ABJA34_10205 [Pseudonocardiales bacterium]